MIRQLLLCGLMATVPMRADCVFGAKAKTSFTVLDSHTIILSGGYGRRIFIKTFAFLPRNPSLVVLKDSFCSYADDVLYVNEELIGVTDVKWLD